MADLKNKMKRLCVPVLSTVLAVITPTLAPAEDARPALTGSVAYAEPIGFDYDRDGVANTVQMWATLEVRPAVGREGEPGYLPEEGTLRRYLKDLDLDQPIAGYSIRNMVPDKPIGETVEVTDVKLNGKTMSFNVGDLRYTVTDGGPGYEKDTIVINDGLSAYPVSLFDGDLTISP